MNAHFLILFILISSGLDTNIYWTISAKVFSFVARCFDHQDWCSRTLRSSCTCKAVDVECIGLQEHPAEVGASGRIIVEFIISFSTVTHGSDRCFWPSANHLSSALKFELPAHVFISSNSSHCWLWREHIYCKMVDEVIECTAWLRKLRSCM